MVACDASCEAGSRRSVALRVTSRRKLTLSLAQYSVEVLQHFRAVPLLLADEFARDFAVAINDVRFWINRGTVIGRGFLCGVSIGRKNHGLILQEFLIRGAIFVHAYA